MSAARRTSKRTPRRERLPILPPRGPEPAPVLPPAAETPDELAARDAWLEQTAQRFADVDPAQRSSSDLSDLHRDGTPREPLPDYPDPDGLEEPGPKATTRSWCIACGRDGETPLDGVCEHCKAQHPERVGKACMTCGYEGEYPACPKCAAPF
jgi:hypothetical protein